MKSPLFSVIIPTRSDSDYLQDCLAALTKQSLSSSAFEVIVVINARTMPHFLPVAKRQHPYAITFVHEPILGAARARNRGAAKSKGKYLAFLDDDAMPAVGWLEKGMELLKKTNPIPLVVGGVIIPSYDSAKPFWFKDVYESFSFGDTPRWLQQHESFTESNMIIGHEAFHRSGGFDESTGMRGEEISSGEERKLFTSLWEVAQSPVAFYSPDLQVLHHVPEYKFQPSYRIRRSFAYGQSWRKLRTGSIARTVIDTTRCIGGLGVYALRAGMTFFFYSSKKQWQYEQISPISFCLGYLASVLNISVPVLDYRAGT